MIRRPMSRYDLVSTEIDEEKIVDLVPSDFILFENNDDEDDDEFESEGGEGEGGKEEENKAPSTKSSARERKRQLENAFRNSMRSITSPVPMSPTTNNDYRRINFATDEAMVSSSTNDDEMPSLVHENIHMRVVTPERELENKKINTDMLQMAFRIAADRSFGLTLKDTEEGIVVAEIDENISTIWTIPANEIQVGMIILKINGKPCPKTMFEVKKEIFNAPIGSILTLDATMPKQLSPPTVPSKSPLQPNSHGKVQDYTSLSSLLNNTEQQAQTSDTGGAGSDCSSNINTGTPIKSILKKKSRYVKPIDHHHHCAWDYTLPPDTNNTNQKHKLNNANQNNSSPQEQVVKGWFDEVWNHVVGKIYNDFAFP